MANTAAGGFSAGTVHICISNFPIKTPVFIEKVGTLRKQTSRSPPGVICDCQSSTTVHWLTSYFCILLRILWGNIKTAKILFSQKRIYLKVLHQSNAVQKIAKTPDHMNCAPKNFLWLAAPFHGCWGQREVLCRVGPPTQNSCYQAKAGSRRSWHQPALTSSHQCSQLVTQHSLGTAWRVTCWPLQPCSHKLWHRWIWCWAFQAMPACLFQSAFGWLFFFMEKRLYCDKRNLPPRKHIIFLSCTPLLSDLPSIFLQDFSHAAA